MSAVHLFSHTTSEGGQAFRQRFRFLLPEDEGDTIYPPTPKANMRPRDEPTHTHHNYGLKDSIGLDEEREAAEYNKEDAQAPNAIVQFFNKCLKRESTLSVLVAMGPFKGSLSSGKAGDIAEAALADAGVARVKRVYLSDGGSGFLKAIQLNRPSFHMRQTAPLISPKTIVDAAPIPIPLLLDVERKTAVLEAAVCCPVSPGPELSPDLTSSRPLGLAIDFCLSQHIENIYIGVGDTGCLDGGLGMAQALGLIVLDKAGREVQHTDGNPLLCVHSINATQMDSRLAQVNIVVGTDVNSPLLGPKGSVEVFGPQKGVDTLEAKGRYEAQMKQYVGALTETGLEADAFSEGSGAGGGIPFALSTICGAKIVSGFTLVAEASSLLKLVEAADLVITGEGRFDRSSFYGKLPVAIARLAQRYKTKVFVFAGSVSEDDLPWRAEGIDVLIPLSDAESSIENCIDNAPLLLRKAIVRAVNVLRIGREVIV